MQKNINKKETVTRFVSNDEKKRKEEEVEVEEKEIGRTTEKSQSAFVSSTRLFLSLSFPLPRSALSCNQPVLCDAIDHACARRAQPLLLGGWSRHENDAHRPERHHQRSISPLDLFFLVLVDDDVKILSICSPSPFPFPLVDCRFSCTRRRRQRPNSPDSAGCRNRARLGAPADDDAARLGRRTKL